MDDKDLTLMMRGMESIGTKVDKIDIDMQYVKGELVRNEEWHKVLNKSVQDIHEAVHGNGKAGLHQEIKCLDDAVGINTNKIEGINKRLDGLHTLHKEEQKKDWISQQEWLKGWRALFFAAATTAATVTITLIIQAYLSKP